MTRRPLRSEDLARPFRYATPRDPQLRTRGGKIAVLAKALGRPLYPHQQYIADVATEINPPGSARFFRYQRVIIAEPRQVGKTTLLRPVLLDRCHMWKATATFMTAQKGKDAGERWDDLISDLEATPFGEPYAYINRGKGSQVCRFPNRSFISPFTPNKDGLHGESPDAVVIDEGWAFDAESGRDLMRAVRPAQITRSRRQLWIMSAAGTAESEYWNELVEVGRASVDDPHSTTAYFEHSMNPDADPYDPASWEFHPGLDGLITLGDLAEEAKPENNTHADFLRGFMNISTKVRDATVIDLDVYGTLATHLYPPAPSEAAFAYDVAIDGTGASVYSAWPTDEGKTAVRVVKTAENDDWLPEFAANIANTHGVTLHAYDGGPARAVTDRLTRNGVNVDVLTGTERSTAWDAFKSSVRARTFQHDGSPAVKTGLEIAVEKTDEDGTRLSRRRSLGPIDAPLAAVTARWFADRTTPTIQVF